MCYKIHTRIVNTVEDANGSPIDNPGGCEIISRGGSLAGLWKSHVDVAGRFIDGYLEFDEKMSGANATRRETGFNLQNLSASEIGVLLEQKKKCLEEIIDSMQAQYLTGVVKQLEGVLEHRRHPLEEVFAVVLRTSTGVNPKAYTSTQKVDEAFTNAMRLSGSCNTPRVLVKWLAVSVRLAAVRLLRMGCYKTLPEVLQAAVEQATKGKGQRHGGGATPFLEQPWVKLYRTHGLGFLLGQADKKYHEALSKPDAESFEREILGAIVYLGMALLALEGRV